MNIPTNPGMNIPNPLMDARPNPFPGMTIPPPVNQQNYYQNYPPSQFGQVPPPYDPNMMNNYMAMYLQQYMSMLSLNDNNGQPNMSNAFNPFGFNNMYNNPYMMNMAASMAKGPQFNNQPPNNMYGNTNTFNQNGNQIQNKKSKKASGKNTIQGKNPNFVNRNQSLLLETTTFDDLLKNLIELSKDPSGSRLIQKKFEECSAPEKEQLINKILPEISTLSKDIFGNYVIQRLMECSSRENQEKMIEQLIGKIKDLTLHMYGCRVVQKALDLSPKDKTIEFLSEVENELKKCIEDQNGNHVIQKVIERLPKEQLYHVMNVVSGNVYELSIHQYGCRVVQKLYDYSDDDSKKKILKEIFVKYNELCQDPFGNYVIQNILNKVEKGKCDQRFYDGLKDKVYQYSLHKFASNVVEKCLEIGNTLQNKSMVDEILSLDNETNEIIINLVKDKYGNYVIQKMIEVAEKGDKEKIVKKIVNSQMMKKRDGFSKHVMNFIEKLGFGSSLNK